MRITRERCGIEGITSNGKFSVRNNPPDGEQITATPLKDIRDKTYTGIGDASGKKLQQGKPDVRYVPLLPNDLNYVPGR